MIITVLFTEKLQHTCASIARGCQRQLDFWLF